MKKPIKFLEKYKYPNKEMTIAKTFEYAENMYYHLPFSLEYAERKKLLTFICFWAFCQDADAVGSKVKELFSLYNDVEYEQEELCEEFKQEFLKIINK